MTAMDQLSPEQQRTLTDAPQLLRILEFIQQFIQDHGYAPSVREIGSAAGIASTSTVHANLKRLEDTGILRRDPAKPRAMVVLPDAVKNPAGDNLPDDLYKPITGQSEQPFFGDRLTSLPFYAFTALPSCFADGQTPVPASGGQICYLPKEVLDDGSCFATCMPDDSMSNRQIEAGDVLIVRAQDTAANGDLIVGALGHETLVRSYFKGLRQVRLQADQDDIGAIQADHDALRIFGVVVGYMHFY